MPFSAFWAHNGWRVVCQQVGRLRVDLLEHWQAFCPNPCRLCTQPTTQAVCAPCFAELPHVESACWQCGLPLEHANPAEARPLCGECLASPPPFARLFAPFCYQPPITDMISRFKYQSALQDGRLLGTWLAHYLMAQRMAVDLIIPVPLHSTRLRQRGFNQAAELAHWVSRYLQVPWRTDVLQRVQRGIPQQGLPRRTRQQNMHRAFQAVQVPKVETVALLDDVVTTGATVRAAAHCLRQAGVQQIIVCAVARTPKPGMAQSFSSKP